MKEILYKGQKCLIVYTIPEMNKKGQRQCIEPMYYLSSPFDRIVPIGEVRGKADRAMKKD